MLGPSRNYPCVECIVWLFCGEGVRDFMWESSEAEKSMVISRKGKKACELAE